MTSLHFNSIDIPASIAFYEISQDSFFDDSFLPVGLSLM